MVCIVADMLAKRGNLDSHLLDAELMMANMAEKSELTVEGFRNLIALGSRQ